MPQLQEALAKISELIAANATAKTELARLQLEAQTGITRGATKGILAWTIVFILVIVGPITWLAWADKMSSDALAFLFGTIIGAAFTFLRNFFPGGA